MPSTRPHHRKISRKELKQPDKLQSFFEDARDFALKNLNQVILAGVIVLIAVVVGVGTYAYELHRDSLASDQFYAAISSLNQNNYKQAEHRFAQLAKSDPGRQVGQLSRLYLGVAYLKQNDLKKARDAFASYSKQSADPVFKNLALVDLAITYERLGQYAKAQHAYAEAARLSGPEQTTAELGVARMLLKQGKRKEAVKAYQHFLQAHPFSSQRQNVRETLALLGVEASAPKPAQPETPPSAPVAAVHPAKP